jgi:hypothetical protein
MQQQRNIDNATPLAALQQHPMQHKIIYILGLIFISTLYGQSGSETMDTLEKKWVSLSDSSMIPLDSAKRAMIGVWTQCATRVNGVTITANACKLVEFKSDNSAIITYPSQEKHAVNWTMSNELLVIDLTESNGDNHNRTFTDSMYEVHLEQDSISYRLELKAKNRDAILYLGRQK